MKMNIHQVAKVGCAVLLSLSMAGCAVMQGKSTPSQYTTDAGITTQIKAKFVQSDVLSAPTVHVETQNGVVQISGFVTNRTQIAEATQIAQSVSGVRSVVNDLMISKRRNVR